MANQRSEYALQVDESQVHQALCFLQEKIYHSRNNQAVIDMAEEIPLMDSVPDLLRKQNGNAYIPTTISIGPLHRGTESLQPMESVKLSYMCSLFKRTESFDETKAACVTRMLEVEESVRNCYEPAMLQRVNTHFRSLSEVMVIDGCFIMELLLRMPEWNIQDPILTNPFKYYAVHYDLLLLENQIPFIVLRELFKLTVEKIPGEHHNRSLTHLVFLFFGGVMGLQNDEILHPEFIRDLENETPYHILHLLHIYYLKRGGRAYDLEYEKLENRIKYSATELRLAGVELKAAGNDTNLFDIKFTTAFSCTSFSSFFKKGHLQILPFSISDSTESFLKNLIAFELSCPGRDCYFTSLCFLMDLLIDTPEDVKLCEEAGIIHNNLGSREEVARLFNGICKNAIPRRFLYSKQYNDAMIFCKPRVSSGRLSHYYFGNPWSGISVVAAIILFSLAFMQTLYTILSYY